jgi:hypothetical protein
MFLFIMKYNNPYTTYESQITYDCLFVFKVDFICALIFVRCSTNGGRYSRQKMYAAILHKDIAREKT